MREARIMNEKKKIKRKTKEEEKRGWVFGVGSREGRGEDEERKGREGEKTSCNIKNRSLLFFEVKMLLLLLLLLLER